MKTNDRLIKKHNRIQQERMRNDPQKGKIEKRTFLTKLLEILEVIPEGKE